MHASRFDTNLGTLHLRSMHGDPPADDDGAVLDNFSDGDDGNRDAAAKGERPSAAKRGLSSAAWRWIILVPLFALPLRAPLRSCVNVCASSRCPSTLTCPRLNSHILQQPAGGVERVHHGFTSR